MLEHLIKHIENDDKKNILKYFKNFNINKSDTIVYHKVLFSSLPVERKIFYVNLFYEKEININCDEKKNPFAQEHFVYKVLFLLNTEKKNIKLLETMINLGLDISKNGLKTFLVNSFCINEHMYQFFKENNINLNFENSFALDSILKKKNLDEFKKYIAYNSINFVGEEKIKKLGTQEVKDYYKIYEEKTIMTSYLLLQEDKRGVKTKIKSLKL